jgi:DNA-binding MarR family transcriptional regulator
LYTTHSRLVPYHELVATDADADEATDAVAHQEAQQILSLYRGLRRSVLRRSRAELARSGLTGAQLSVISLLGTRGPMTLTALSHELAIGHSTVSGIVDRLQARGIVERAPNPADRRETRVSLTDAALRRGRPLADDDPGGRLAAELAAASGEQRRTILKGLELLRQFVDAAFAH